MSRAKKEYSYDFPRPALTVDVVLLTQDMPRRVLLIKRKSEPFAGSWALPGGFVNENEDLEMAARRELLEEAGIEVEELHQFHAFAKAGRDPRGWTVSIAFGAHVDPEKLRPEAKDDAAAVAWHKADSPPSLAFDHAQILNVALRQSRPG